MDEAGLHPEDGPMYQEHKRPLKIGILRRSFGTKKTPNATMKSEKIGIKEEKWAKDLPTSSEQLDEDQT
uniref:Uncharacterized protein n=1 Tax=Romanomermis culicivorax TaxID=13658 RepID=A0A915KG44_ROMCU